MILWACLSAVFLGVGSLASGLLSQEKDATIAILLFLVALAGTAGCIFYFYLFLREISPKPKDPYISTLP
jgi:drug/metabolite transporter (DMT)-like permease